MQISKGKRRHGGSNFVVFKEPKEKEVLLGGVK